MKLNPQNPTTPQMDVSFRAPASSLGAQLDSATPPAGVASTVAWHNLPLPKEEESLSRPRRDPYEASRERHRREAIRAAGSLLKQGLGSKAPARTVREPLKLVSKTSGSR